MNALISFCIANPMFPVFVLLILAALGLIVLFVFEYSEPLPRRRRAIRHRARRSRR